jgi:hypothetical protein
VSSPWVIHPRTFSLLISEATRQHAADWLTGAILLDMSRYDSEPERESSRTVVVVLLSLVILTVIGALLGYVLGRRNIDSDKSLVDDRQSPMRSSAQAEECPDVIETAVAKRDPKAAQPLHLALYIKTQGDREVWICREDDQDGTWYQGLEKGNRLLLGGVTTSDVDKFVARNDDTVYRVSRKELSVTGDQKYVDPVILALPPA